MPEEESWNWIEEAFRRVSLPYPAVALLIGAAIYMFFWFFNIKIDFLEPLWDNRSLTFLALSAAISCQLAGIMYLLGKMKIIFSDLDSLNIGESKELYTIKNRFMRSRWYYILLPLIILPFYVIDFLRDLGIQGILFSCYSLYYEKIYSMDLDEKVKTSLIWQQKPLIIAYDIYFDLVGFLFLFFLAVIIWIIFNIAWGMNDASAKFSSSKSNISIFSLINILISIRSNISKIVAYYFICIALAILSYPITRYFTFEIAFLLTLLLLGVLFFLVGIEAVQSIMKNQAKFELDEINEKSKKSSQKLILIASEEDYSDKKVKIDSISSMLDILQKERERILLETKGYDMVTTITFIGTFLIPFLTFIEKYWPKVIPILQNNTTIIDLSHIIPK